MQTAGNKVVTGNFYIFSRLSAAALFWICNNNIIFGEAHNYIEKLLEQDW